ncbi:MAG: response regulator transcription factor [Tannerella sp.]|jgi:DNA-binding NarL/FixJ family response regulator|nr:response regulator transcription factor [Tannerella sp.]
MKKTFILADNQYITREGIASALTGEKLAERIVTAGRLTELQDALGEYPDAVVVLDYSLFDFSSQQQMLAVKAGVRDSLWILFSGELGERFLRYVLLQDDTLSVVMKHDGGEEIMAALQNAAYGEIYICDYAAQVLKDRVPPQSLPSVLTPSEKTILREIALGKMTKEIAWEKHLSFHTVNSHRKNIFRKIEVNSIQEAIRYAICSGIIDMSDYYI